MLTARRADRPHAGPRTLRLSYAGSTCRGPRQADLEGQTRCHTCAAQASVLIARYGYSIPANTNADGRGRGQACPAVRHGTVPGRWSAGVSRDSGRVPVLPHDRTRLSVCKIDGRDLDQHDGRFRNRGCR
jgi:hypothetical protein